MDKPEKLASNPQPATETECAADSLTDQMLAARQLLEQRLPAQALPYIERASELAGTPELAALAGTVAVSLGELPRAVLHFQTQVERDATSPEAHFNLGLIAAFDTAWPEAASHFQRAVNLRPDDAGWQNDLAVSLYKSGEKDAAESAFRTARELDPAHRDAVFNLADFYIGARRMEDAFLLLVDYLRHEPGDEEARAQRQELWERLPATFRKEWRDPAESQATPVAAGGTGHPNPLNETSGTRKS